MDHLFRAVKGRGVAKRPTITIDQSTDAACRYLNALSRQERLLKAGGLSTRTDLSQVKAKFEKLIFRLFPTAANACLTV
jgi:hypothetical protein